MRRCAATSEPLPRFFLEQYSLLAHPETGRPWWVPRGLRPVYTERSADDPERQRSVAGRPPKKYSVTKPNARLVVQDYLLARHSLLRGMQTPKSSFNSVASNMSATSRGSVTSTSQSGIPGLVS